MSDVEILNIDSLTPIQKSNPEWRYYCPVCPDKRGKEDKDGKLYWNIIKQRGYCFKCQTSFYPEGSEVGQLDKEELEYQAAIGTLSRVAGETTEFDNIEYPIEVHFDFPELTPDLLRYLKNRNPFLIPLKDVLGIRAWKGRDTGVVVPFLYKGKICKFQNRFVTKNGKPLAKNDGMKYYTSPGPKPLYCPFHIFNDFKTVGRVDELTICEGVFDAIALAIMGFPNPVAILGDRLTPLQMWDIRHINNAIITKVNVCLDDEERNQTIVKVIRKTIPTIEETKTYASWRPGKDPEEYLVANLKKEKFKTACAKRVQNWVTSSKRN